MNIDMILYVFAFVCLLLAGLGVLADRFNLPWLAGAALVLSLIV